MTEQTEGHRTKVRRLGSSPALPLPSEDAGHSQVVHFLVSPLPVCKMGIITVSPSFHLELS